MKPYKFFKYISIAIALALLSACGGGGGANTPAPAPVPTPAPAPAATGQITIWTALTTVPGGSININIDNINAGSVTTFLVAPPTACGQTGTLTVTLPVGLHTLTGASAAPGMNWSASPTIVANQCLAIKLL